MGHTKGMPYKYFLFLGLASIIALTSCSDYHQMLSGGCLFVHEGSNDNMIFSNRSDMSDIYSNVLDYDYDVRYIVVLQKPDINAYALIVSSRLHSLSYKQDVITHAVNQVFEDIADSIVRTDPKYTKIFAHKFNYWIISHKEHKVFGPYTKAEYWQKRKDLGVPECLELRDEPK